MPQIATFAPDYPGAIVYPAASTNCYNPANHGGVPNRPRAGVIHTPEERADNVKVTPRWFAQDHPEQAGSTTYFVAFTPPHIWQCVPESWGAIANGLLGRPLPTWAIAGTSLNWQTWSVEVEGFAHNIASTLIVGGDQYRALVELTAHRNIANGIPLDREHIVGHYQLASDRTDPGAGFPWDPFIIDVQREGDRLIRLRAATHWVGKFFPAGARMTVNASTDFDPDIPSSDRAKVRAYDIDVALSPGVTGSWIVKHGSGHEAGRVTPGDPHRVIRVYPRGPAGSRVFDVEVAGGQAGVLMALAGYMV